jgi:hypothetical protein
MTADEGRWHQIRNYLQRCKGKKCYDEASATFAASRLSLREREQFDSYECPYCKNWHIDRHAKMPFKTNTLAGEIDCGPIILNNEAE